MKQLLQVNETKMSFCGGLIFSTIFMFRYAAIDSNLYEYRDDGVITLSVGKNLVEYGFIGVSPSGPIVEASSSPLQMLLYALVYSVTGIDYITYSYWQTIISTFFIGFIFIKFFLAQPITGFVFTILCAFSLTFAYPFFLWHGSGMENALTHLLFWVSVYILYTSEQNGKINYWAALLIFAATICRIDSVYHISALLVLFSIYWYTTKRSLDGFYFSLLVFSLWLGFQTWRFFYFGDLRPNTAYAQGISVKDRLFSLITLDVSYLIKSMGLAIKIFIAHFGWLLLLVPALLLIKKENTPIFLLMALGVLIATSALNPFLFGATRIDISRTTTQMALFVHLAFFISAFYASFYKRKAAMAAIFALPVSLSLLSHFGYIGPYYLGWSTIGFNKVRNEFGRIAKQNSIQRPTISNPDLGVMTWYKEFNVIDLGLLGSPVMAKLVNGPEIRKFYLTYGLPDIIEAHGSWVKRYCDSIFTTDVFNDLYRVVRAQGAGAGNDIFHICKERHNTKPPMIYWIRKDIEKTSVSNERIFLTDLQVNLTADRIIKELTDCAGSSRGCHYIARTVYKFIPELREKGIFDAVLVLFDDSTDRALLEGWRSSQAHVKIVQRAKNK